jgi:crossover junction endodeoxyribonuclease RusA
MITIEFPQPDKYLNANDRLFWAVRAARVRAWRSAAHGCATRCHVHPRPRSIVGISLPVRSLNIRRDGANWHPTLKACIDGLVDAGLWPDDCGKWVVTEEPCFHLGGNVRITITECTP